jgi:hypothetical protein
MAQILALANRLRGDGVDCWIDQFEQCPDEGWPNWMIGQIRRADFVLVICTAEYTARWDLRTPFGRGRGVKWEGAIITTEIYEAEGRNSKFVPVLLSDADIGDIPLILRATTHYTVVDSPGYIRLYRRLTRQPEAVPSALGNIHSLEPLKPSCHFEPVSKNLSSNKPHDLGNPVRHSELQHATISRVTGEDGIRGVHVRLGNIFDNASDLVLLPCSAKGTFTKAARQHVDRYRIPSPNPMEHGEIQLLRFTGSGATTKYVAWCASVLDDSSSALVIEQIARRAGEVTKTHPNVRLIETPLLGTGHGGLLVEESALALARGFAATSHRSATLVIYAWTKEIYVKVRAALEQADPEPKKESPSSSPDTTSNRPTHDGDHVTEAPPAVPASKSRFWATWIFGTCSFLFLVGVFLFAPQTLPAFKQRLLAWFSALCSGFFAFFLTGSVGLDFKSTSSRFGQIAMKAGAGSALFLIVLWWWYSPFTPVKADHVTANLGSLEQYAKGAPYPDISVELYYGPTQGMTRTMVVQPLNPGIVSVLIENTNNVPVYDLIVSTLDCSPDFNHSPAV